MLCTIKKDYNIKLQSKTDDFLNADFVYYPYKNNIKLKIKLNDYVYKNMNIFDNGSFPIFSSVSGKCIGTKKMSDKSGKTVDCLVIENDFKEKVQKRIGVKKNINTYTREEVTTLVNKFGIFENDHENILVGDILNNHESAETLIINTIESEPYMASELFLVSNYIYEILETVDALMQIFSFKKCLFIIKNNASEIISKAIDYIGTYPNIEIKLIDDLYPIDNYLILKKYLKIPSSCILKSSTIYKIYLALKRNMALSEKLITITGNAIINPKVINVKIGTPLKSVINEMIKIRKNKDIIYIANGLISGNEIDIDSLIVTPSLNGLIINEKNIVKTNECIKCGQCYQNCPVNINPVLLVNNKKTDISKCLHCGLCSYVCPANININKYLEEEE